MDAMWHCLAISLLAGLTIPNVHAGCIDHNSVDCAAIKRHKSDFCSIQCLAQLCKKTCGLCHTATAAPAPQLQCYQCSNIDRPNQCSHIQQCNGGNQSCIVTQVITTNLEEKFQLGCVDDKICQDLYSTTPQRGKRSILYHGHCCKQNKCNHVEPELAHTKRTTSSQTCSDIDIGFCSDAKRHGLSNNNCIAEILCPYSMGKCLRCRSCEFVAKPEDCKNEISCAPAQACAAVETVSPTYHYGYRLGCASTSQCSQIQHGISHSKRSISNGYCCNSRLCNQRSPGTAASLTATASPASLSGHCSNLPRQVTSFCPTSFSHLPNRHDSCYYFHPQKLSQPQADALCKQMCGRLVILSTTNERQALTQYIQSHLMSTLHLQLHIFGSTFWTDAVKSGQGVSNDFAWSWNTTKHTINTHSDIHWRPGAPDGHIHTDGEHCLDFGPYSGIEHGNEFYSDDRNCGLYFHPLCEYNPNEQG